LLPEDQIKSNQIGDNTDQLRSRLVGFPTPTVLGKTAVAAQLIAMRKVNKLILVHGPHLMDQWRERPALYLGRGIKDIGQIGGGKTAQTGHANQAIHARYALHAHWFF
jgi:superfamily II DNA or RNA helicase